MEKMSAHKLMQAVSNCMMWRSWSPSPISKALDDGDIWNYKWKMVGGRGGVYRHRKRIEYNSKFDCLSYCQRTTTSEQSGVKFLCCTLWQTVFFHLLYPDRLIFVSKSYTVTHCCLYISYSVIHWCLSTSYTLMDCCLSISYTLTHSCLSISYTLTHCCLSISYILMDCCLSTSYALLFVHLLHSAVCLSLTFCCLPISDTLLFVHPLHSAVC